MCVYLKSIVAVWFVIAIEIPFASGVADVSQIEIDALLTILGCHCSHPGWGSDRDGACRSDSKLLAIDATAATNSSNQSCRSSKAAASHLCCYCCCDLCTILAST
jgi:hypothetical protein